MMRREDTPNHNHDAHGGYSKRMLLETCAQFRNIVTKNKYIITFRCQYTTSALMNLTFASIEIDILLTFNFNKVNLNNTRNSCSTIHTVTMHGLISRLQIIDMNITKWTNNRNSYANYAMCILTIWLNACLMIIMPVQTYLLSDVMGFMYQQANLNIPYILSQVRVYMYLAAKEGHTFLTKIPHFGP